MVESRQESSAFKDAKNRATSRDAKDAKSNKSLDRDTFKQLEKDSSARKSGKDRATNYDNYKSKSGGRSPSPSRSMGSFGRGGGGGFRGGGGRR